MGQVQASKSVASRATTPADEVGRKALRVPSGQLLGERGELVIEHNGREYRLRLTQSGKLILTA